MRPWVNAKVMAPFSVTPYTSSGCLMLLKATSLVYAHGVYTAGGCSGGTLAPGDDNSSQLGAE